MPRITIAFHNANPDTVWNRLAARLGREPTSVEAAAEVLRILDQARCERAEAGRLSHQRKR
ncbi:hypothetical protein [Methylobacterium oryzisoli]|uniref:hypothetical protein n=1 Tax=Methylobacterium oryzisoli TaxID=3385502 RepID=UPI00397B7CD8